MDVAPERVELLVADGVEVPRAIHPVARLEGAQRLDDRLHIVADHAVAPDHIRVDVREVHLARVEQPLVVAVEKDGAAAEERLDVPAEAGRIVAPQGRQELPLAAGPFEDRPNHGDGLRRLPRRRHQMASSSAVAPKNRAMSTRSCVTGAGGSDARNRRP